MSFPHKFRKAEISDVQALDTLIELSARGINNEYYTESEINAALGNAWAVDIQLIHDKTYWIVENDENTPIGCGGWSKRKLLFGKSNDNNTLEAELLIPGVDAARIRAFFIHPKHIRQGIGKQLLFLCEKEAIENGFDKMELVATLSGEKLYRAFGYLPIKEYEIELGEGITNRVISMSKSLKVNKIPTKSG